MRNKPPKMFSAPPGLRQYQRFTVSFWKQFKYSGECPSELLDVVRTSIIVCDFLDTSGAEPGIIGS